MRILLSGMLAGVPHHGGASWVVLQYALGLERLGHRVFFVEPVRGTPSSTGTGDSLAPGTEDYFQEICSRFGLTGRAAMLVEDTGETIGAPHATVADFARSADLLINLSGVLGRGDLMEHVPTRLYVDLDPGFTQLWAAGDGIDMGFDQHTHHATVGLAVPAGSGPVPTCGLDWVATVPPVVLEHWPFATEVDSRAYTSVANWRGYGSIEHEGVHYGQKAHAFRALADLPLKASHSIEIALGIHPSEVDDLELLARHRWSLLDPDEVAGTAQDYQRFVASSRGELGIAKTGYVVGRTGWFSDRSACYLASGRPVITQETGFSDYLPTGHGLWAFSNVPEAVAALDAVESDYEAQRRSARTLAEEHLDSDQVLANLLRTVMAAVPAAT